MKKKVLTKAWALYWVFTVFLVGGTYLNYKLNPVPSSSSAHSVDGHPVGHAPDFRQFTDTKEKKAAFFNYLKPGIEYENSLILKERETIQEIQQNVQKGKISKREAQHLKMLAEKYRVDWGSFDAVNEEWVNRLLHKVDVIPVALVLIQAANESAWGTSRFARDGNNYFGQWCYQKGCGLVPLSRNERMSHEVAKFSSVQTSIRRYFLNVNRNDAYRSLRDIRWERRQRQQDVLSKEAAIEMTNGLLSYSERGQDYVDDLQAMLRHANF